MQLNIEIYIQIVMKIKDARELAMKTYVRSAVQVARQLHRAVESVVLKAKGTSSLEYGRATR